MHTDMPSQHQPYAYTTSEASKMFSINSIPFLPLSLWIGDEADRRGRDFPWLRRAMLLGLALNLASYLVMVCGPGLFPGPLSPVSAL